MHIMEGYLPLSHAVAWTAVSLPFLALGVRSIQKQVQGKGELKMLLGVCAAYTFVLSALKLPSLTGSCSHPTGTGLGAILFGPWIMGPLGLIVLLFQAVLLAHGGLSTLGANVFSMGIAGPFIAFGVYKASCKLALPRTFCIFMAAFFGDLMTYVVTSFQLALAFPSAQGGLTPSLAKFLGIFALTQIPLAISEALLTVVIANMLVKYHLEKSLDLNLLGGGKEK